MFMACVQVSHRVARLLQQSLHLSDAADHGGRTFSVAVVFQESNGQRSGTLVDLHSRQSKALWDFPRAVKTQAVILFYNTRLELEQKLTHFGCLRATKTKNLHMIILPPPCFLTAAGKSLNWKAEFWNRRSNLLPLLCRSRLFGRNSTVKHPKKANLFNILLVKTFWTSWCFFHLFWTHKAVNSLAYLVWNSSDLTWKSSILIDWLVYFKQNGKKQE